VSELFRQFGFLVPGWKDLLEIVLVAAVFYRILQLLARGRGMQILVGLLLLVAVAFLARILDFRLIQYLLENLFQFGAIAAIVVFQPELRQALARLGQYQVFTFFDRLEETEVAEEIAQAAEELSRGKVGAIIAIEREVGLGDYVETGTEVHARVSAPMLSTIFTPYSPLHDGAAVVRGDQILAAGVILPLTQFPVADKSLGTRHRAAIGLSEETDAIVIVVSEETSQISVAHRGALQRDFDRDQLARLLAAKETPLGVPA
jgi:diadenylate cyclase